MTARAAGVIPRPPATGPADRDRPVSPTARQVWRRLRFPLVIAAVILAGGAIVVLLQPHRAAAYLDPGDPGPAGARALSQILTQRGHPVVRAESAAQAAHAVQSAQPAQPAQPAHSAQGSRGAPAARRAVLVVTDPQYLTAGQLAALARLPGDRVLVQPTTSALRSLAPGVQRGGQAAVQPDVPGCGLGAALLAGEADTGGLLFRVTVPAAARCYRVAGEPSLVSYGYRGRTVTVLGTGAPLTNGDLANRGNAALALNLLENHAAIIWLSPGPAGAAGGAAGSGGSGGQTRLASLIPGPVYLIAIQLAVAALVAASWRMRRLGPLVAEPLPVAVRAAETVEGHGRLYRARRSRATATAALREALLERLVPVLGLPHGAGPGTIAAAIGSRTGRPPADVAAALYGAAPADDTALVRLADTLDALEREVRQP